MRLLALFLYYIKTDIYNYFLFKLNAARFRLTNKHNGVSVKRTSNIDAIQVGVGSYGELNVLSFKNQNEKLIIGNYVSIASNVTFILGGNHQRSAFSNYPIASMFTQLCPERDAQTKGEIIVEDEVWIGANVIILSGITIGKGAIVAAGSVVTKDVKPFSIVGGNPARFIRYRIPENLIEERKRVDLIDIDRMDVTKNIDLFYQELNPSNLETIKKMKK